MLLAAIGASAGAQATTHERQVVALWSFDENDHPSTMLSDAGPHYWDLRLDSNLAALVPGRFGNALRPGDKAGVVTLWAMGSRPSDSRLNPFPYCPRELVRLLAGDDWTLEFWLRLTSKPSTDAVVVAMGPRVSGPLLEVSVSQGGSQFVVRGTHPPLEFHCSTTPAIVADGRWHHLTFLFEQNSFELNCFLDGEPLGAGMPKFASSKGDDNPAPGLVLVEHADMMLAAPMAVHEIGEPLWNASGELGSKQFLGQLRAPVSGDYRFEADAPGAVRLEIDGHAVIERGLNSGSISGAIRLEAGRSYDFELTTFHAQPGEHRVALYWERPGATREIVPAGALTHSPRLLSALKAELDMYAKSKEDGFVFSIGRDLDGQRTLEGEIDELCFSRGAVHRGRFSPASLSKQGSKSQEVTIPPGPRPLALDHVAAAYQLGKRKHVFIDGMLVEQLDNVQFRVNRPIAIEATDLVTDKPWEAVYDASGAPSGLGGSVSMKSCYDYDDTIRIVYSNDGMWRQAENVLCLAESADGLHFEKPSLRTNEWRGSTDNNIILVYPGQGSFIVDKYPSVAADERIKFFSFGMERGVHVFTSSDGTKFARSGTTSLCSDIGGGVEAYWDDQRGDYGVYLRHEGFVRGNRGASGRAAFLVRTTEPSRAWDIPKLANPEPDKITEEFPIPFQPNESGQVYRTQVVKYDWTPDVYLAFPWRMLGDHVVMQTELATNRNGADWTFHGIDPAYISVTEDRGRALATHGLVKRGAEIWQYAEVESSRARGIVRVRQRLDGFTGYSAGSETGSMMTKPLLFAGDSLSLNVAARGKVRVAVLNPDGTEIPGFGLDDCRAIEEDSVKAPVRWEGAPPLAGLAGIIVRLKFEMEDADLYAFEFE